MQVYGGNRLNLGNRLLSYRLRPAFPRYCRQVPRPPTLLPRISRRQKYPAIRMGPRLME